uniref:Uncharacterized protein n=1 Tax=Acrobeloides nanus TaxID=290746 RepID=A0A914E3Y7_9BILA
MQIKYLLLSLFLLLLNFLGTKAAHKCVWVRGVLRCNKNPTKHFNVEVRVWDKDGVSIFQAIDPDDLMGVSFTDEDGTFALDGCGDDFDWIPGLENKPEPYVQILHYCNNEHGETIQMPIFKTFVPQTHDMGIMELDEVESSTTKTRVQIPALNPKFNSTVVRLSGQHEAA